MKASLFVDSCFVDAKTYILLLAAITHVTPEMDWTGEL